MHKIGTTSTGNVIVEMTEQELDRITHLIEHKEGNRSTAVTEAIAMSEERAWQYHDMVMKLNLSARTRNSLFSMIGIFHKRFSSSINSEIKLFTVKTNGDIRFLEPTEWIETILSGDKDRILLARRQFGEGRLKELTEAIRRYLND